MNYGTFLMNPLGFVCPEQCCGGYCAVRERGVYRTLVIRNGCLKYCAKS